MKIDWTKPSNLARIAANAIPLVGIFGFGWRVFPVLALYWLETAILGAFTLLRMWTARTPPEGFTDGVVASNFERTGAMSTAPIELEATPQAKRSAKRRLPFAGRVFMSVFFCVHFGMFMFVHGTFLFLLMAWSNVLDKADQPGMDPSGMVQGMLDSSPFVPWAALALALSHLVSYVTEFLGTDERYRNPQEIMVDPYRRVMLMHIAILFGATLTAFFGQPVWALVLLIVGKTILDLRSAAQPAGKLQPGIGSETA